MSKSIYKDKGGNSKKQKMSTRIKWDEDNLQLNEDEKVPRMKIDEPDTPYHNALLIPSDDEDCNDYNMGDEDNQISPNYSPVLAPHMFTEADIANITERALEKRQHMDDDLDVLPERKNEDANFALKRKDHYKVANLKALLARTSEGDDMSDEGEDENNNNNSTVFNMLQGR